MITFLILITVVKIVAAVSNGNIRFITDPNTNNVYTQFVDSMKSFKECASEDVVEDEIFGTFQRNDSHYCTIQTQRIPPGMFCCTPQASDSIRLLVSSPKGGRDKEVKFHDESGANMFANDTKIVYLAHGWMEKMTVSPWVNTTRDGYLKRGYTVIVVDWGHLNELNYWQAVANVRTVGKVVGYSILKWKIVDRVLVVGFSLGGQIVAEAGQYVIKNGDGRKIEECHGLDPAGPWFDPMYGFIPDMELDKDDCKVVQVVHSSASYNPRISSESVPFLKLGSTFKSGHCDFWINCGHSQSCKGDSNFMELMNAMAKIYNDGGKELEEYFMAHVCSHWRASLMYSDAVNKNCDKNPIGSVCTDCGPTIPNAFNPKNECTARPDLGTEAFPPDNVCTPYDDVNYAVFSTDREPFCQGKQD